MSFYTTEYAASTSALENEVIVDGNSFTAYWSATANANVERDSRYGHMGTDYSDIEVDIEHAWPTNGADDEFVEDAVTLSAIESELLKLAEDVEFEIV